MKTSLKRLIYFFVAPLILIGAYLYFANGFIYYRIGASNLSAPIIKNVYIMNENSPTSTALVYAAIGDSLTAGAGANRHDETYPYLIAEHLALGGQKITLKNFSYPGAKTQDVINDLLDRAIESQPDVITILIGVNDIHNHISSQVFHDNYEYILKRLSSETPAKIYVINIPIIGSKSAILPPLNYYFDNQTRKFNKIIKDLAFDYNLRYIDLYTPTKNLLSIDGPHYSSDSFHPSKDGYKWWTNIIYDSFDR